MSKNFEKLFFFSNFFDFFSKKVNFSKTIQYFFLVVSLPPRRVFKTFSEKISKKIKIFKFVKKFRTTFFFQRFFRFFFKKSKFLKNYYISNFLYLMLSIPIDLIHELKYHASTMKYLRSTRDDFWLDSEKEKIKQRKTVPS